jgi:sterol desaturase/sphingolipid hydroxylase (fatty acid hydroxylase superfamily)
MQDVMAEFGRQLSATVELLTYAYLLLAFTWPVFLLLERLTPVVTGQPGSNLWFNWKIVLANFVLSVPFYAFAVTVSSFAAGAIGGPLLPFPLFDVVRDVPFVGVALHAAALFLAACFFGDFWYYWWHRAQHEFPFLWELHKLHHSEEHLNTTSIYRSHFLELPGQATVRGFSVGLLVDLQFPETALVAVLAAGLAPPLWDFFIHANVRIDWLHRLLPFLSTPQFHWIHHSDQPEHQGKNYAIWLPLFDRVFGSYYEPRVDEYPTTGLSSGEKIDTLWEAEAGPFIAWARSLRG